MRIAVEDNEVKKFLKKTTIFTTEDTENTETNYSKPKKELKTNKKIFYFSVPSVFSVVRNP
jgi:hypothetical protein